MLLSGRPHNEGRLNEGPRIHRKHKDENEANQTKVTPDKDAMAPPNQTPEGYKFAPLVWLVNKGEHEPARARSLWAILSLVLPVRKKKHDLSPVLAYDFLSRCKFSTLICMYA